MPIFSSIQRGAYINFFSVDAKLSSDGCYVEVADDSLLNSSTFMFAISDNDAEFCFCKIAEKSGLQFDLFADDRYEPADVSKLVSALEGILEEVQDGQGLCLSYWYSSVNDQQYLLLLLEGMLKHFRAAEARGLPVIVDGI